MLTQEQLIALLSDLESDRIERCQSLDKTDKFAQAICAFANDLPGHRAPGYLIAGVDDAGKPTGLNISDQVLQNLAAIRSDGNIQPLPAINVAKYSLPGGDVAVMEVQPCDMPPVRYRGQVWIRVGPRRAIATSQEERILTERRISSALTFDATPCLDAALEDLSLERFALVYRKKAIAEEVIAENNRPIEVQLASLRLFDLRQHCPTYAGLLLLADYPTHWIPGAYVQFVRFEGNSPTSAVVTEKRLEGSLDTMLQQLDLLLDLNLQQRPVFVTSLREEMRYSYPRLAVRELALNAIMHRDYQSTAPVRVFWFSQHIEIHNPGSLFGAAMGHFPWQTDYRNPIVAETMRNLGYVNRFGIGVIRAQDALINNGNPPPDFRFESSGAQVTLYQNPDFAEASNSVIP